MSDKKAIYIHIPFCVKKCAYCDFYSVENLSLQSEYTKALLNEINLRASIDQKPDSEIDTIYFGGGTPSTISISFIEQILSEINKNFNIHSSSEITMEVNPGTIDKKYISDLKALGINRLNIGVQSFQDKNLSFLGRIHSAKQAKQAIEFSKAAGFENTGIDLIYGLPCQTEQTWINNMDIAISYKLQHLSCYMLTFEKNTLLYNQVKKGLISSPTRNQLSNLFLITSDYLTENNYIHYEISNFSTSLKTRSKHNQKYWNQTPYSGFGASAHSFDKKTRFWNYSDIEKYISELNKNILPIAGRETLTEKQKTIEFIMLGLRTKDGIRLKKLNNHYDQCFDNIITRLEIEQLGKKNKNRFSLTQKGMCHLDNIIQFFVDCIF